MNTFRFIATSAAIAISMSAALATGSVAVAQSITKVEVQPYELETAGGRAAVVARIERAAERLCYEPGLSARRANKACTEQVSQQMLGQLGSVEPFAQAGKVRAPAVTLRK